MRTFVARGSGWQWNYGRRLATEPTAVGCVLGTRHIVVRAVVATAVSEGVLVQTADGDAGRCGVLVSILIGGLPTPGVCCWS